MFRVQNLQARKLLSIFWILRSRGRGRERTEGGDEKGKGGMGRGGRERGGTGGKWEEIGGRECYFQLFYTLTSLTGYSILKTLSILRTNRGTVGTI